MSDPKSSYGEPVEEPTHDDDVVGRAHQGLADAEAARQGVEPSPEHPSTEPTADQRPAEADVAPAEPATSAAPVVDDGSARAETAPAASAAAATPAASTGAPWYAREDDDEARWAAYAASADAEPEPRDRAVDETPTVVAAPAVTASEPAAAPAPASMTTAAAPSAAATGAVGQPIFVQAPEAPHPRGNRGAAAAIGLLAAVAFAVLYLAAALGLGLVNGDFAPDETVDEVLAQLTGAALWVPVVVFYLAFLVLGAIINRGRWGHWVVWGLLVGVAAWGGHILGALFQAPFWELTSREGTALIEAEVLAPLAIVAFVLGRELTIWFGAWVAARGRRVTEINLEAQREYERTLEAGPQLHRA